MEKLILLTKDVGTAKAVIGTLHGVDINDNAISVVADEHTPLDDLPEADLLDSDVVPAYKRGIAIGGTAGLLAGLTALAFPPAGIVVGGGAVLTGALGGASFGAFAAALIGVNVPHSQLDGYEQALKQGQVLVVADVDDDRLEEVTGAVKAAHPDLKIEGTLDFVPPPV